MNKLFKRARVAVAAVAVAGCGIAASAVPASAAVHNTFTICAYGNYTAYGVIPQLGGYSTDLASPGQCQQVSLASGSTYAHVYGLWNTHPQDFSMSARRTFRPAPGGPVAPKAPPPRRPWSTSADLTVVPLVRTAKVAHELRCGRAGLI